ncbi:MAG: leucine-rich repeat domain-containing protein [Eubacteriales bacterium]|nr:leucine-rich repeat domain-containing protein [Eubacteriales bacterium]
MKKRIIALALSLMLLLSCTAVAQEAEYSRSGVSIYDWAETSAEAIVPSVVDDVEISVIAGAVFNNSEILTSCVLPETIKVLAKQNFYLCPALTSLTLPESLEVIDETCISSCAALTELTIPSRVWFIGPKSLRNNESLKTVRFTGVAPVTQPDEWYPYFENAPADLVIYVPDDQIDAYKAIFPEGLNIQPSGANAVVHERTVDESLFTVDPATGEILSWTGSETYLDIPASVGGTAVTGIGAKAFADNRTLVHITVPEGVVSIGDEAFVSPSYLRSVDLPDSVQTINYGAFVGFKGNELRFPAGLLSIGDRAFVSVGLLDVTLPEGFVSVGASAFEYAKMDTLNLPSTLQTIGDEAFFHCVYIEELTLPAGLTSIGASAFAECDRLQRVTVECDPALLPAGCFADCGDLVEFILPGNTDPAVADALAAEYGVTVSLTGAPFVSDAPVTAPANAPAGGEGYVGVWTGIRAEADGEVLDRAMMEMIGLNITMTLNADGSAIVAMAGEGEEQLNWYEADGMLVVDDGTMDMPVQINADGTLLLDLGGVYLTLARDGAAAPVTAPAAAPADDTSAYLGAWYGEDGTVLTILENGEATAEDEYGVSTMTWGVEDGKMMILTGSWWDSVMTITDGVLNLNDGYWIDMNFTREQGAAPAVEGAQEYIGVWTCVNMSMDGVSLNPASIGMTMQLTVHEDGTAEMYDGEETMVSTWTLIEGGIEMDGMPLSMLGDGSLYIDMDGTELYFAKGDGAASAPAAATVEVVAGTQEDFIGEWNCTLVVMEGISLSPADIGVTLTMSVSADGTLVMVDDDGPATTTWTVEDGKLSFEGMQLSLTTDGRLLVEEEGANMFFERTDGAAPAGAPAAGEGGFAGDWIDADGLRLTINAGGTLILTYPDGDVRDMTWQEGDGSAEVTSGNWWGCTMVLTDANTLSIDNGWVVMTRSGAAPAPAAAGVDPSAFMGAWYDEEGGVLTFFENGEVTFEDVYGVNTMGWEVQDGQMMITTGAWWDSVLTINNGVLNVYDSYYIDYNFTREQSAGQAPVAPVGGDGEAIAVYAEQSDFVGLWFGSEMVVDGEAIALADIGMTIEINMAMDGTITLYDGEAAESGVWSVVDGAADIDGMLLRLMSDGTLVGEDEDGTKLVFTGYTGEWKACYLSTGGLTGDLRSMGITSTLILNADGTGSVDFPSPEQGVWYREGTVAYFGENGMPMTLLNGGFLKFGSDLAGYVIYSQDENAQWDPNAALYAPEPVATPAPAPVVPAPAPQAPAGGGEVDMHARMERKYVAKTYTAFGQTMDASMLGAEYSLLFRENGTCDFGIAGMVVPNLNWGLQKVATGLTEVDAFVINYYGTMFNAVLIDAGFDMDYYGTMTLHFVPAE